MRLNILTPPPTPRTTGQKILGWAIILYFLVPITYMVYAALGYSVVLKTSIEHYIDIYKWIMSALCMWWMYDKTPYFQKYENYKFAKYFNIIFGTWLFTFFHASAAQMPMDIYTHMDGKPFEALVSYSDKEKFTSSRSGSRYSSLRPRCYDVHFQEFRYGGISNFCINKEARNTMDRVGYLTIDGKESIFGRSIDNIYIPAQLKGHPENLKAFEKQYPELIISWDEYDKPLDKTPATKKAKNEHH